MSKQLHTARAAASGLAAAELAALGFSGPRLILEGPLGFYAAMCADPRPEAVLAQPEEEWLIHSVSFKPWPACRHGHATIDAALKLHGRVAPEEIEEVVVRSYADAITVCDCAEPTTTLQAKFSLQHTAAIVLVEGPPPLEAFDPAAFPRAAALRRRVRIEVAEPYASAYPARYGAGVTVRLKDGRTLAAEAPDALGDPENPVTPAQVEAKARMLMTAAGVEPEPLVAAAKSLAGGGRIAELSALLP
jgi:2-methylcitrate dehydratase PrpD